MKNEDKVPYIVMFAMGCISMLVIAATTVAPGKPISQYPRATDYQGSDIFIIARTNVSPATNLGVTGNVLSNFIASVSSNTVKLEPGTNVTITTNVSGNVVTYTISVTNAGGLAATNLVWTNDNTVVYTLPKGSIVTNSIQIYTNGGLSIGRSTLPYWVTQPGAGGESLISVRNITNEIDFNELFIAVQGNTNLASQDFFMNPALTRRLATLGLHSGATLQIDEYIDDSSNFVFRAFNSTGSDMWHFRPNSSGVPSYLFNSANTVPTNDLLLALQNNTTNKFELYGDGKVNITSQITNQFLTASKLVLTDASKGLISSSFGESDLTNILSGGASVWTNSAGVVTILPTSGQASTNVIIQTNGYTTIAGQITNHFLFTNKFVMTDVGKGLVSSSIGEDDLGFFATTNYVNCAITSALGGDFILRQDGFGTNTTFNHQTNLNSITWTNLARLEGETNYFSSGIGILALRNGVIPQEFWVNNGYVASNNQTGIRMFGSGASMYIQAMSRPSASCELVLGAGETGDSSSSILFQTLDVTQAQIDVNGALKPGTDIVQDLGVIATKRWNNVFANRLHASTIANVGGLSSGLLVVSAHTTLTTNITTLIVDSTSSNIVITLPTTTQVIDGLHYWIKNIGANLVTINPSAATQVIDLGTTTVLTNRYDSLHLTKDRTNWWKLAAYQ